MPSQPRFIVTGGIGDAIMHTPLFRAVKRRHPTSRVSVFCEDRRNEDVFRHNPTVLIRRLPPLYARYPKAISRAFGLQYVDGKRYLALFAQYGMTIPRLMGYSVGVDIGDEDTPELFLTDLERAGASRRLHGLNRPIIGINVQTRYSPSKNWPLSRWSELVAGHPNCTFIQLGQEGEPWIPNTSSFIGCSLRESFALLAQCDVFIGLDSGLAHAATALNVPALVLFGPSAPASWGYRRNTNLYSAEFCSPCLHFVPEGEGCPFGHTQCMKSISVERVSAALQQTLERCDAAGRRHLSGMRISSS